MKTIAENLRILKDSTDAIKQAIIDNGGTVTGGLSSYADAINALFLITFTIDNVEYKAKKDMTWEDWVNSEYNIDGYIINSVNNGIYTGSSYFICHEDATDGYVSSKVLADEVITNKPYYLVDSNK